MKQMLALVNSVILPREENSDPCGSSKKIILEITEPEKKTVSRGRPKSGKCG